MTKNKAEKDSGKRVYLANQNINKQLSFLDLHAIRTRVSEPSAWNTSQIPADLKCRQLPLAIIAKISASTAVSQFPAKNRHGKGKELKTNYYKQHKRDSNSD